MQLGLVACLCALSATALADAEFASVRRRLRKDMSARRSDPPQKYFRMSLLAFVGFFVLTHCQTNQCEHAQHV